MVVPRAPRFTFATDARSPSARAWSRARAEHDVRSYVVVGSAPLSVRPVGIRAWRTVRRDLAARPATVLRGWHR